MLLASCWRVAGELLASYCQNVAVLLILTKNIIIINIVVEGGGGGGGVRGRVAPLAGIMGNVWAPITLMWCNKAIAPWLSRTVLRAV